LAIPDSENSEALVQDLIRRITKWRTHPRRQQKEEMLKAWKEGTLIKPNGELVPSNVQSKDELNDIIGDIYSNHLDTFQDEESLAPPLNHDATLTTRPMANTPRSSDSKPFPPLRLPEVLHYVNKIWSILQVLPTVPSSELNISPSTEPDLPGSCPYPELVERGFIQPRPGALLYTEHPPEQILTFSTPLEFEQYIYSLAFHRDISPRTGKMIMSAFLSPNNVSFLTYRAFRYAIVALIERASDIYSARRLAEYMTFLGLPLNTDLWNVFLLASVNVESVRSFALILREILVHPKIQADGMTWNLALRMGIKIDNPSWVYSVMGVMKRRGIQINELSLKAVLQVLRKVITPDQLKDYYFQHFSGNAFILWRLFNIVLGSLCENNRMDEAWDLLVEAGKKHKPPEATLHLFIRMCRRLNDYERVWKVIGEFRERWRVWPTQRGITILFHFAYDREEFSDVILIWEFARLQQNRWPIDRAMMYKARDLEREYGAPLRWLHATKKTVTDAWYDSTSGRRNPDVYHRIEETRRNHVKLMRARVHSERHPEDAPVPDGVQFWRAVDSTYKRAVEGGLWIPRKEPRSVPLPNHQREYFKVGKQVRSVPLDPVSPRVDTGINFLVREKMMVWKLVQGGRIKLKD
jgi:pentatricopeptide repeat protein